MVDKVLQKVSKDVRGLFYLCAALFVGLALASFHKTDPSLNSITLSGEIKNYCGFVGAILADLLYQVFGMGSWAAVAILGRTAWMQWARRRSSPSWAGRAFLLLAILNLSALLQLHWGQWSPFEGHIAVGGWAGSVVSAGFVSAFNFVGAALILWCVLAVSLLYLTQIHLVSVWDRGLAMGAGIWEGLKEAAGRIQMPSLPSLPKWRRPARAALPEERTEPRWLRAEPAAPAPVAETFLPLKSEPEPVLHRRKVRLKSRVQRRVENWKLPDLQLLEDPPASRYRVDEKEGQRKSLVLVDKLSQFAVAGEVTGIKPGPSVTMFEFRPRSDVKISKITELADDLSLALSSESVRIIAPIPGRDVVGIETANQHRETVYLKDIVASDDFWQEETKLPLALGRQADGVVKVVDLRTMPHLLVAGTTGSGKSVFVVSALTGLIFRHSPKTLRLILIDPKQVDLSLFENIPHLLMPVIHDVPKAVQALKWAVQEMEKRYRSMSRFGARGLEAFNEIVGAFDEEELKKHEEQNAELEAAGKAHELYYFQEQPYITIVVEEFGDLMTVDKGQVESLVVRLAQMARACGMHLVLAMQSPRKDVVTGLIKTNIPGRISFKVASKMDSRIILDDSGAERLLARGDMLFLAPGVSKPERHHGPWLSEEEISEVTGFWSSQGEPEYHDGAMQVIAGAAEGGGFEGAAGFEEEYDERYDEILAWTATMKEVSASLLQRKFRLGYPRAARLVEIFEREGVLGPANGSKPRKVLISSYEQDEL